MTGSLSDRAQATADVPLRASPLALAAFGLAIVGTWLAQHPYAGFEHDARIYLLLALNWLEPETYANDILVAYGSQGTFTLYPAVAGTAIAWLQDAAWGMFAAWVLSYVIFLAGLAALVRALLPTSLALLAFGLVLAIPGDYGISGFLAYGESISTPRPAAEGLVLLAFALASRGRRLACLPPLILAFLLHPLVAMPALLALALLPLDLRSRGWLAAVAAAGTLLVLGFSSSGAPGPLASMDADWLSVVRARAPYLFPGEWSLEDWNRALMPMAWMLLALRCRAMDARVRSLAQAALLVGAAGLLLALATLLVPNVLLVQGQPWRWAWVVKILSVATLPIVVPGLWRLGGPARTALMLAACGWMMSSHGGAALVLAASAIHAYGHRLTAPARAALDMIAAVGLLLAVTSSLVGSAMSAGTVGAPDGMVALARPVAGFLEHGLVPGLLVSLAWWFALRRRALVPAFAIAAGALALSAPAALATVDELTAAPGPPPTLDDSTRPAPGSVTYWPDEPVRTWLELDGPSYVSMVQATISLFSRPAAMEVARRNHVVSVLRAGHSSVAWEERDNHRYVFSAEAVRGLCADPGLDYLVLPAADRESTNTEAAGMAWTRTASPGWHLQDCRAYRSEPGDAR